MWLCPLAPDSSAARLCTPPSPAPTGPCTPVWLALHAAGAGSTHPRSSAAAAAASTARAELNAPQCSTRARSTRERCVRTSAAAALMSPMRASRAASSCSLAKSTWSKKGSGLHHCKHAMLFLQIATHRTGG